MTAWAWFWFLLWAYTMAVGVYCWRGWREALAAHRETLNVWGGYIEQQQALAEEIAAVAKRGSA